MVATWLHLSPEGLTPDGTASRRRCALKNRRNRSPVFEIRAASCAVVLAHQARRILEQTTSTEERNKEFVTDLAEDLNMRGDMDRRRRPLTGSMAYALPLIQPKFA